jgi:hypothetical protein
MFSGFDESWPMGGLAARRAGQLACPMVCLLACVAVIGGCSSRREKAVAVSSETSLPPSVEQRAREVAPARLPAAASETELPAAAPTEKAGADWNDAEIKWLAPAEGLALARRTQMPVCLVIFTTWCPHCAAYSHVFKDPRIVEASRAFVMVRVDADRDEALGRRYALDGEYIPRTFFLDDDDGKPDGDVRAHAGKYAYYYDEDEPGPLLASMRKVASRSRAGQGRP